ncbi:MAG: hypothetical protein EHM61_13500 [Acidobacteria bacterium]|nr:MAG: hypothetical protein EHM61_13500 [Acidobacteriota bacterium]
MIKDLLPGQVVCNEKNEKGKPCHGKLKRYYPFASYFNETDSGRLDEIKREFGQDPKLVLLRCEDCRMIYRLPQVLKEQLKQA